MKTKTEKVQKELQKLTGLNLPSETMELSKARKLITDTPEAKKVIQELRKMKVNSEWLGKHGFIIASMLLGNAL